MIACVKLESTSRSWTRTIGVRGKCVTTQPPGSSFPIHRINFKINFFNFNFNSKPPNPHSKSNFDWFQSSGSSLHLQIAFPKYYALYIMFTDLCSLEWRCTSLFCHSAYNTKAEDFMLRDVKYVTMRMRYREVSSLLSAYDFRCFPLIDSTGNGCIRNCHNWELLNSCTGNWHVTRLLLVMELYSQPQRGTNGGRQEAKVIRKMCGAEAAGYWVTIYLVFNYNF